MMGNKFFSNQDQLVKCESCKKMTKVTDGGLCRNCIEEARRDTLEQCESCHIPAVLWQGGLCGHCYEAAFSDDFTTGPVSKQNRKRKRQDIDDVIEQSMIDQHLQIVEKEMSSLHEIIQRTSGKDYLEAYQDRVRARNAAEKAEMTISVCMQEAYSGMPTYRPITTLIFNFLLSDEEVDLRPFQDALEYLILGSLDEYSRTLFRDANNLKAESLMRYSDRLDLDELHKHQFNLFEFKLDLMKRQEEIRHNHAMRF